MRGMPKKGDRPPALRVDEQKFPNVQANPALEKALRILQALERGRPREEAVRLAEVAMGRRAPAALAAKPTPRHAPKPTARPPPQGARAARRRAPRAVQRAPPRRLRGRRSGN